MKSSLRITLLVTGLTVILGIAVKPGSTKLVHLFAAPEPTVMLLLGMVLAGTVSLVRKRLKRRELN